jgi:hypothetical protein
VAELKTLVEDIGKVLTTPQDITDEEGHKFGKDLSDVITRRLREGPLQSNSLRMSNLGTKCLRKLWYTVNAPEKAEPLHWTTRLKFLYGDLIEELVLFLTTLSGHSVSGRQGELNLDGIKGHRDAKIDGVLSDVKSASGYGFKKFEDGLKEEGDAFGYLTQLAAYQTADRSDDARDGAFIAVNKENGNIVVDYHPELPVSEIPETIRRAKAAVNLSEPPERHYGPEPDGKSGNQKLSTPCSYCQWKSTCWPGLRGFAYSGSPRFLTRVERSPEVPEFKVWKP